jgi:hypothetical protein
VIGTTSNAVPVIVKTLNVPDCFTYGDVYRGMQTDFKKEGAVWREYAPEAVASNYEFKEVRHSRRNPVAQSDAARGGGGFGEPGCPSAGL